ncbi:MAG: FAD:protein FMN transferase [Candidatus Micrarchaeia archaeon]
MEIAAEAKQVLGTKVEIKLPSRHSSFFSLCFSELSRIEKAYSRFIPDSELSVLNSKIGKWQDAGDELLFLAGKAEEFRAKTDGQFDISLKETLENMGYDSQYSFKPKKGKNGIASALSRLLPAVKIDRAKRRILLNRQIEFGGLGKGYALDCVAALLEKNGVKHYYINAGGDIYAKREEGTPQWEILLEHPDDPERAIGKIALDGKSIAGSAPNRRKWGNGEFHHLINAKTGKPAQGVKCVFVVAGTGIEADAYATAIFTAGFERGIALSRNLPVEILMVSEKNKMYQSAMFGAELFG